VGLLELQLRGVLDGDDALVLGDRRAESTLSSVVLPEPVPPEMTMFFLALTARVRKRAICSVIAPNR
jgi:hypothetical protein